MELIQRPSLLQEVKDDITQARVDDSGGVASFDAQKLVSLPLLQSIFTEVMRLHVRVLITRTCVEPVTLGGYDMAAGSTVQAPTEVAHLDESICRFASPFQKHLPARYMGIATQRPEQRSLGVSAAHIYSHQHVRIVTQKG